MTKYEIKYLKPFKTNLKKIKHDKESLKCIKDIIEKLANDEVLDKKHKDHALKGNLKAFRECHIKPDLLLIYQKLEKKLILYCINIGSHGEIF
ncbi:type II toxin-antitoxin system YafQ family toxin [Campylobacter helveticus]|uniref:Type II toxin-antitoxin system YafQ family toxin n=1 Tax=Campylobacter helveticus TaxID=28898 RepID=A0ABY3L543_9BACT|nr:type II toxin-antitoxin system YafQ family toxin [Campylobacter helveticus]MCR2039116.1 type II toxin-antitoxin system YafQ family toxin [Campylobacter helveticus]TXK60909.1 type II toxin-antitoxin system YafQ family toxin [Campylobacter helveticus]